jgi:serine/threonine protein kinase
MGPVPDGGGFDLDALLAPFKPGAKDLTGQTLSGCVVEKLLGRGAMGEVWLARRASDGSQVVVKRIDPVLASDPILRARLQREWSSLALVGRHPNVVAVQAVALDAQPPHLVLDLVPGTALDALLARRRRLPALEAARVARDLALGLAAVHGQGLVHRDVKPANAILRPDGVAVLVDFGLAKDVFASSLTQPGTVLGTAAYMAPEQWGDDARGDVQTDLFALGATLYHLATGAPPFEGDDVVAIAERAAAADYAPLEDAPQELALLVDLLLEPEPRFRPARALDVAGDLARVLAGQPCGAPALLLPGGARAPLVRARRWTLGTDPTCQVVLPAGASPRHAQLRREQDGFVLVDLKGSAGTTVQGAQPGAAPVKVEAPRQLAHGDRLVLGTAELGVRLTFVEPHRAPAPASGPHARPAAPTAAAALALDGRRLTLPEPAARALLAGATPDPRAAAWLLELLEPDPHEEAGLARALAPLGAEGVLERRRAEGARQGAWAAGALAAAAGLRAGSGPADLRAWWVQSRGAHPLQVAPWRPARTARLLLAEPGAAPRELPLGDAGVLLVGRDPRCHVPLTDPAAPRLAATLVRLHRRWLVRDERGARQGAAAPVLPLDGDVELGGLRLRLVVSDAPWPTIQLQGQPAQVVDAATFLALEAADHPATATARAALLDDARRGWPRLPALLAGALDLLDGARAQLVARAAAAQARPAQGPWAGPAVAPAGWLEAACG